MSNHPLTDKICRDLTGHMIYYSPTVQRNDMRAAYDLGLQAGRDERLKDVVAHLNSLGSNDNACKLGLDLLISHLLVAMQAKAEEES